MEKRGVNTPRRGSREHNGTERDTILCIVGHTGDSEVDPTLLGVQTQESPIQGRVN